ncbi:hypothetical protein FVE85_5352 [Porphyridium purpureum]|uniref:Uncharacterized protein n=1 Tax=Porphyridium purpureum TaxID=35688 RepID=A0A5J4Z579_PORPP|nr:hypothetical protein FVE85_5352 [Porphyridium purpureum]|eukprot:POR9275..scf295_1
MHFVFGRAALKPFTGTYMRSKLRPGDKRHVQLMMRTSQIDPREASVSQWLQQDSGVMRGRFITFDTIACNAMLASHLAFKGGSDPIRKNGCNPFYMNQSAIPEHPQLWEDSLWDRIRVRKRTEATHLGELYERISKPAFMLVSCPQGQLACHHTLESRLRPFNGKMERCAESEYL